MSAHVRPVSALRVSDCFAANCLRSARFWRSGNPLPCLRVPETRAYSFSAQPTVESLSYGCGDTRSFLFRRPVEEPDANRTIHWPAVSADTKPIGLLMKFFVRIALSKIDYECLSNLYPAL